MGTTRTFPLDVMALLVSELQAGAGDWQSLMAEARYAPLRERERWFNDRQRGMFYRLQSPRRRMAFLQLQAGSGNVSACLSEDYDRGYAIEHRALFAAFIECRLRGDRIANVEVVRACGSDIPLDDACADLVAIDEPISAAESASGGQDSGAAVAETLRHARRCLARDGRLIMAVDNAWHVQRPLTVPERSGDFGSVPGQMRRLSPIGYRRLLQRAGFGNPRLFVVKTRRQLPIDIYSHHRDALEQLYRKYDSRSRTGRFVKRLSDVLRVPYLAAHFQPSYYLVGDR